MVLATQNPIEHHGTYPLPESQLDRFLLRVRMGYPARASEKDILRANGRAAVESLEPAMEAADVVALQHATENVRVEESLLDYALEIVERTRQTEQLSLGVSTRGRDHAASCGASARISARTRFLRARRFQAADRAGVRASRCGEHAIRFHAKEIRASRNYFARNCGLGTRAALMAVLSKEAPTSSLPATNIPSSEAASWRNFIVAMFALALAFGLAIYSGAAAQTGARWVAGITALSALALAGWVAITIVPALARRSTLRWLTYHVSYRVTREGIVYLAGIFIVAVAALNTGNNLLFLVLGCMLAGIVLSGILSRITLTGIELQLELPEHVFAGEPAPAVVELTNFKRMLPSFALCVTGAEGWGRFAEISKHKFSETAQLCWIARFIFHICRADKRCGIASSCFFRSAEFIGRKRWRCDRDSLLAFWKKRASFRHARKSASIQASSRRKHFTKFCRC